MDMAAITAYIELDPQVRFGKPVVKGTRTTVAEVLEMLANGMSAAGIAEDFLATGAAQGRRRGGPACCRQLAAQALCCKPLPDTPAAGRKRIVVARRVLCPHCEAVLHVNELGLDESPNVSSWRYARQHGYDLPTKDEGFMRVPLADGFSPRVVAR